MSSNLIENLVAKAQKGDADSFGELYSVFAKDMYRFALYYTGSSHLAEDAVSDAALSAFEKIGQLKKRSAFKSWLFSILFNCCKKQQREKALSLKRVELSQIRDLPESEKPDTATLRSALSLLESEEKEILLLSFIGGYTGSEIAKMLSLNSSSVRSKKSRAVNKLREMMR